MGSSSFKQMKSETPLSKDPALTKYIQCVALAVAAHAPAELSGGGWEVAVFDQPKTINAFALPGGKIGVYTGLLQAARTPAQLAAVLGHEVGHVIARHGNERVSQALAVQGGLIAVQKASGTPSTKSQILVGLLGAGAQYGIILPHGRTQESEADLIGLDLMARAGFDPRESVELWKNMAAASGGGPPEFLSTHPSHTTRIEGLQSKMAPALAAYQQAKASGQNPVCRLGQ